MKKVLHCEMSREIPQQFRVRVNFVDPSKAILPSTERSAPYKLRGRVMKTPIVRPEKSCANRTCGNLRIIHFTTSSFYIAVKHASRKFKNFQDERRGNRTRQC